MNASKRNVMDGVQEFRRWSTRLPFRFVAIAIVVIGSLVTGGTLHSNAKASQGVEHADEREKMRAAVDALETAVGDSVPVALERLKQYPVTWVREELVSRIDDVGKQRVLSLAYGLAAYQQLRLQPFVDAIENPDTSPDEVPNLVAALSTKKAEAIAMLDHVAADAEAKKAWVTKARLAILSLYLGESTVASDMLRAEPSEAGSDVSFDTIQRSRFIAEFSRWSGDLEALALLVADSNDAHFRSGMALSVGGVDDPSMNAKDAWELVFARWHTEAVDSGTHGATAWAMQKWGLTLPEIAPSIQLPSERDWWNLEGLTMIRIRKGIARGEDGANEIEQEFWLCDRAVTIQLFERFMAEAPVEGRPNSWEGTYDFDVENHSHYPVQEVNWLDAIMFCNWLSDQYNFPRSYDVTYENEEWKVSQRPDATGFRLPTEVEWEFACRAMTTTKFSFGDDVVDLGDYAWFDGNSVDQTHLDIDKCCNAWGLFGMHGNVKEWCWDPYRPNGYHRVARGGSWNDSATFCHSSNRTPFHPSDRINSLGFRVALGPTNSGLSSGARRFWRLNPQDF